MGQVVAARAQDDTSAEARALSLLERALYEEGRGEEAPEIGRQVIDRARRYPDGREILQSRFETWMRYGVRLEEDADGGSFYLLELAHDAYCQALAALDALADAPESLKEEARTRAKALSLRQPAYSLPGGEVAETVVVGFLAVKVLGPFLEEWARKLGEQFGESTVRALGRIRVRLASLIRGEEASADRIRPRSLRSLSQTLSPRQSSLSPAV